MADAKSAFDQTVDGTTRMAKNLEESRKSAEGLSGVFNHLTRSLLSARLMETLVHKTLEHTKYYQRFVIATNTENMNASLLTRREIDLMSRKNFLEERLNHLTGFRKKRAEEALGTTLRELEVTQRHLNLAIEVEKYGKIRLGVLTAFVVAAQDLWIKTRAFNQDLLEANSSYEHREKLFRETLIASAQLGIGFGDVTKSAAALVHYGLDTSYTFATNVRLVSQLDQGLGIAVQESARLASIVEKQLKGSFESIANVLSDIVENTSLAGAEAVKLATAIGNVLGRLRPGLGAAGLPEVVRLVSKYESALKEISGQSGGFQQLMSQLTTPEGIVGAGALNVSPEFLSTSKGVQTVMDRFAQYGEMLVGQSQGWERQFRLQALAQIFNVSADSANQMLIAIKHVNDEQVTEISLQDRWRNQLHATNSGISRLLNSLMALLNGAVYPVVFAVGAVTNKLADFVEWALKSREVVYAISGVLGLAFTGLVLGLGGVARGLWAVVFSSRMAEAALLRYSAATAAGGAASSGASLGWGLLLSPLKLIWGGIATLANMFGVVLIPLTFASGMLGLIWRENRNAREQAAAAQKIIISRSEALEARRMAGIFGNARYQGTAEEVMAKYSKAARDVSLRVTDPEMLKAQLAKTAKEAVDNISMGVTTKRMTGPLMRERTLAERQTEKEMLGLTDKIYQKNEAELKLQEKRMRLDAERTQEVEEERAKHRFFLLRGTNNWLGIASDYWSEFGR